jgi:hypothetical protein
MAALHLLEITQYSFAGAPCQRGAATASLID